MDERKQFRVVAALIVKDGKVLLTQRWPGRHLGLTWEFPGGKVEDGEDDREALERELKEELGVTAEIGSCCFETRHGYGSREVHLLIFRCKLLEGTPRALDVKAMEWADLETLVERKFPPADLLFVQELVAGRIKADEINEDEDDDEDDFKPAQVVRRPRS
ncbi:MAG: (deoxy)nucleoside triphosphate pyrophosphohydrolase [Myxococcales bacterium]|nr:(deoxy)nucleoside triphosphate pyrophosphohydrolase [Myxococcales bacterium]USN51906.1 MAG: (deoxy)nucleoside triphosphate pyrophosphohydrolase [Myxococcales bacterium]